MELQTLHPLPRQSLSPPSAPQSTSFTSHGLFNIPLHESEHSLRTLFRTSTDHSDDDDEDKSKANLTFYHDDGDNKPPIAFAEDLFHNGIIVPLRRPSLKLPPRLQAVSGGGVSPRSPRTAFSPKFPRKIRSFKGWKDFDPFAAAVERIRKEDASLKSFHWRQLERSFKESYGSVFDDEWGESEWDLVVETRVKWMLEGEATTFITG